MRRAFGVLIACAAACVLWVGYAATPAQATAGWKVVNSVSGGLSLPVPKAWSVIPPDKSTPGVVLQAFDEKLSLAIGPLGVQMVIIPGGSSLATFSTRVLSSVRKQPLVGGVTERSVRLSARPARLLRYRVHAKPQDVVIDDYVLVVGGKDILVTFSVPYSRAGGYEPTFARSIAGFRARA